MAIISVLVVSGCNDQTITYLENTQYLESDLRRAESAQSSRAQSAQSSGSTTTPTATGAVASSGIASADASTLNTQASASPALSEGVDVCLDSLQAQTAISENLAAKGWKLLQADAENTGQKKRQRMQKAGVDAYVIPDGGCTFRSDAVAAGTAMAETRERLRRKFQERLSEGSPYGRHGVCDGYTVDLGGQTAWVYFTAADGNVCQKSPGLGITTRIIDNV
ncbi:MAG: hypothetical protein ACPGNV_00750 [Mangrovicoccus sp.]